MGSWSEVDIESDVQRWWSHPNPHDDDDGRGGAPLLHFPFRSLDDGPSDGVDAEGDEDDEGEGEDEEECFRCTQSEDG